MSHTIIRAASQTDTSSAADGTDGVPTKRDVGQRCHIIIKLESRITLLIMSYICHIYWYEQQIRLTLAALIFTYDMYIYIYTYVYIYICVRNFTWPRMLAPPASHFVGTPAMSLAALLVAPTACPRSETWDRDIIQLSNSSHEKRHWWCHTYVTHIYTSSKSDWR